MLLLLMLVVLVTMMVVMMDGYDDGDDSAVAICDVPAGNAAASSNDVHYESGDDGGKDIWDAAADTGDIGGAAAASNVKLVMMLVRTLMMTLVMKLSLRYRTILL